MSECDAQEQRRYAKPLFFWLSQSKKKESTSRMLRNLRARTKVKTEFNIERKSGRAKGMKGRQAAIEWIREWSV